MTPSQKPIFQGAEAKIILVAPTPPKKSSPFVIKDRIPKSYRLKELDDKIRKLRTRSETKLLTKAFQIINSPKPFPTSKLYQIKMPFIDGKKLSEHLDNFSLSKQKLICKQIGESIAKLHDKDIIHGDLTTSNMILVENQKNLPVHSHSQINQKSLDKKSKVSSLINKGGGGVDGGINQNNQIIFFIDFGLGFISHKVEDKAVDLHLLKQALEAKHFGHWEELIKEVFKGYKKTKDAKIIFERLKAVEKRGRYKHK